MKTSICFLSLVILGFNLVGTPFQNLDFDAANTNNISDQLSPGIFYGPISEMLPGWQLSLGTGSATLLGYNAFLAGNGTATLADYKNRLNYPVVGVYTLVLSGIVAPGVGYTPFLLTQTGDVPVGVRSIWFTTFGATYDLAVNGAPIGLTYDYLPGSYLPNFQPASVRGDISDFAGQTVELQFTTVPDGSLYLNGLDDIFFSTVPVPEPASWLLFSLGGSTLLRLRRRAC